MEALLLVDIQNDFLPGGALAVPHGDEVIAVARRLAERFPTILATQDHHPDDHRSFASQWPGRAPGQRVELAGLPQVLWPDHCVQGTRGAELAAAIASLPQHVVPKGEDREVDSYSGFFDNGRRRETRLEESLVLRGVDELYVMGLATDYCVLATVLDAISLGFRTHLVLDGCRAVDLAPGDGARAIERMRAAGAIVVESESLMAQRGPSSTIAQ